MQPAREVSNTAKTNKSESCRIEFSIGNDCVNSIAEIAENVNRTRTICRIAAVFFKNAIDKGGKVCYTTIWQLQSE